MMVPDNTTVVPSSGKKCEEIGNTGDDDDRSQDARGHHGGDLICVVMKDDDRQGAMSGDDDDNVVSNITTVTPPATQRGVCVHSKGGVCSIRGPGAKLRWRFGGKETERTKEGQLKTTSKRVYFYVCGPRPKLGEEKILKQSRLSSFIKTKKTTAEVQDDTNDREFGDSEVKTPTEGKL